MKIRTNVKAGASDGRSYITNHNEKLAVNKQRLVVKTGVKAGGSQLNHNEKLSAVADSIEQKKSFGKKLRLSKETIRELKSSELKQAVGGAGGRSTNDPTAC